jgi:hypothetical protein
VPNDVSVRAEYDHTDVGIVTASELDAIAIRLSVFALITEASELEAVETVVPTVVTSDCVASEPASSVAPVSVLVALLHTSVAIVPNELSVLEV